MADHGSRRGKKKATNVSLSRDLLDQAQALGVGVCEARTREWQERNREAIDAANAHVQAYGLPFERYRQF
jgi:antitoxin CcdA